MGGLFYIEIAIPQINVCEKYNVPINLTIKELKDFVCAHYKIHRKEIDDTGFDVVVTEDGEIASNEVTLENAGIRTGQRIIYIYVSE